MLKREIVDNDDIEKGAERSAISYNDDDTDNE